jgi:hypothetical protein
LTKELKITPFVSKVRKISSIKIDDQYEKHINVGSPSRFVMLGFNLKAR